MIYRKEIGYIFLNIRKRLLLDQSQMSLLMGVKKNRYSLIERGLTCIKQEELQTFLKNIEVDEKLFHNQVNFLKAHYINTLGVPFEKPSQYYYMLSVADYTSFIKDIVYTYQPCRDKARQVLNNLIFPLE